MEEQAGRGVVQVELEVSNCSPGTPLWREGAVQGLCLDRSKDSLSRRCGGSGGLAALLKLKFAKK